MIRLFPLMSSVAGNHCSLICRRPSRQERESSKCWPGTRVWAMRAACSMWSGTTAGSMARRRREMRVAINGFGRIGRTVFRILDKRRDAEVVAINDLFDNEALRYLLNYDTVMGPFEGTLRREWDDLVTSHGRTRMLCEKEPLKLPWAELGIDVVVEATGIFTAKEQLNNHLRAGAKRVLLTVPAKDEIDYTVVLGVNDEGLNPQHRVISNASCTTNCLAPLAKVLHDAFGIVEGMINTVHAY